MNQQNNPNNLNQNQSVIVKLEYDANENYTFRRRILPDIIEIFDKHPVNHVNDYNRVRDDGHWELVLSKQYFKDTNITKKKTPTQELRCPGNAVRRPDSDFTWIDLEFDELAGLNEKI
tara:strand:- start:51 stop:404 length:354 start_codon:yes stop_codon:yes gene_type:complete